MPASPKFKLDGVKEMERNISGIVTKFPNDAGAALLNAAEAILALSIRVYVPVDLGPLRASGQTAGPEHTRKLIIVAIAFGSPTVDYAVVQHEEPDFQHTVGEYKYLEIPLMQAAGSLAANLARELRF
jgi:hypothetical protein